MTQEPDKAEVQLVLLVLKDVAVDEGRFTCEISVPQPHFWRMGFGVSSRPSHHDPHSPYGRRCCSAESRAWRVQGSLSRVGIRCNDGVGRKRLHLLDA